MIVHIVIFKLIQPSTSVITKLKEELLTLRKLSHSLEFSVSEKFQMLKTYLEGDVILFSTFKNEKQLELYMTDPKHLEVIKNTSEIIEEKYVFDFIAN
ncbi:Dabb family protein [uncultured Aquimarina sp.]|uniref:Dabb family protein n=1 Tax=uncultured Aquimarina sp. TaxID=575652 RepID=UPI002624C1E8|nr:Dabb family protein [uncultured Aquimarina sp.]